MKNRPWLTLAASIGLSTMLVAGCGGDDSNTQFYQQTAQQNNIALGTVEVRSILSRAVPSNVTHIRFLGFNQNGYSVYGPVTVVKSAVITLSLVPVEVKSLLVTYMAGEVPVGTAIVPVVVVENQITVLNDINFSDVTPPVGPTGPTGPTGPAAGPTGPLPT